MDSASHLTKNITETLDRLLSQLSDLDELKEELEEEEYDEMKKDTLAQIQEFEVFLQKNQKDNEELAAAAQKKLEEGKAKSLGMAAMKQKVEGHAVETLRVRLAELKFQNQQKKTLKDSDFRQQSLSLLLQIERMTNG